ncbi:hypothetical protein RJ641_015858 [Dillenia turbinata]|uniref:MalT-like TPR region domain-containing protein n=1 Tax=Dillenia turbinata TaxID=194707 RepID=A0AAN8UVK9_9MAGN
MKLLEDLPGQQSRIAGIEAQRYGEARSSFESAIGKLRASGEKKSSFFGIVLNQMGLACVQMYRIEEAAELFEEAMAILEQDCGSYHLDTIGVYSNLAVTYDAMGRISFSSASGSKAGFRSVPSEDAIEVLEHILKVRKEKLGTANPDVDDEKKRLAKLAEPETGRENRFKTTLFQTAKG